MKKFRTPAALLLIVALLCAALGGCASSPAAVRYRDTVITSNMYQFYLSRYKAQILSSYNNGQDNESFWQTAVDEEGATFASFFGDLVKNNIQINAICVQLFSDYGLKLADDVYSGIDSDISGLIEEAGSRSDFNLLAAQYGVNDKILRDIYVMDAKVKALYSYLYGEGGVEAITDEEREAHYRDNYVHLKTIFVNTTYRFVMDEAGELIYDEEGYAETADMTAEEKAAAEQKAAELKARLEAGEGFEGLIASYSDDPSYESYPDGFYFTKATSYYGDVIDVAYALSDGEWGTATSEYGTHFVLRLPLAENAYENDSYSEFFEDMDSNVANEKFDAKVDAMIGDVVTSDSVIGGFSIVDIPQNQDM